MAHIRTHSLCTLFWLEVHKPVYFQSPRGGAQTSSSLSPKYTNLVSTTADIMDGPKVISMNVNGLNNPTKICAVFDYLRKAKADFYLLQETHSSPDTEKIWRQEWSAPAYFCNGNKSSRGVAILVIRDLVSRDPLSFQSR